MMMKGSKTINKHIIKKTGSGLKQNNPKKSTQTPN